MIKVVGKIAILAAATILAQDGLVPQLDVRTPPFSVDDATAVRRYWTPERLVAQSNRPYVARQTVAGSEWLWNFQRRIGLGKSPAPDAVRPTPERLAEWQRWIDARYAFDLAVATEQARLLNAEPTAANPPVEPGPAPDDMVAAVGVPPILADLARPTEYRVQIESREYRYEDFVNVRPKYAYLRFNEGVIAPGKPVKLMPAGELQALLARAEISESQGRVFRAVSLLEGGFESVNTYDTGYLSVGFIQFATLREGGHSLGEVLMDLEEREPTAFRLFFRRFGVDVNENGQLHVVNLDTGDVLDGEAAVRAIIRDKRLTAVFQHAGEHCPEFRVSQLRVAKARYFPADDEVLVNLASGPARVRIGEIISSEAGLATLMDRKVNTGNYGPLATYVQKVADAVQAAGPEAIRAHEFEIVERLKFRHAFLGDASLSQPETPPRRVLSGRQ
ncbi:MAG: hypothetical protein SFX74_05285 [Fimbriimonadaceae bacterium]|nr:hypothetical protein [Fimbriimonadaceae bacterium]